MPARTSKRTSRGGTYYEAGTNNVECDRTGFKTKATQGEMEWNGYFVRKQSFEERQPLDFLRGIPDRQQPAISRPGTGDEFLAVGEVTPEDL